MFYKFNFDKRYEYNLLLRKPNMEIINEINNDFISNISLKFNDLSSITLDIPKYLFNKNTNKSTLNPLYNQVTKGRIITLDDKYAFRIINFKELDNGKKDCRKTVQAYTIEKQLERRKLFMQSMTRQIKSDDVNASNGVMDFLIEETNGSWKLGYLDEDARHDYINGGKSVKYRNLESQDKTWLSFIKNDCTSAFRCLWLFDSFKREINIWDEKNLNNHSGLTLSHDTFINDITKDTNNDSCITRLKVSGKDGLVITNVNPLGTNYVENFDSVKEDMSDELQAALDKYYTILETTNLQWQLKRTELLAKQNERSRVNEDIVKIKEELKGIKALQTAYIKANDNKNLETATNNYNNKEKELNNKLNQLNQLNTAIDNINKEITVIVNQTNRATCVDDKGNKIFAQDLLEELDLFIEEDSWENTSFLTDYALYDAGVEELKNRQTPTIEFSVNVEDFLSAIKDKEYWDRTLRLGDYVLVCGTNIGDVDLRLIGIDHNNNTKSLKLTFSNKTQLYNEIKLSGSISSNKESTIVVNKNKDFWEKGITESTDFVREFREQGLDLAASMVNGRTPTNRIWIDEYGIMIEDVENEGAMLYISSGLIAISDDGFKTCKTAIDKHGLIGETICGKILLGEQLFIADTKGIIKIEDGKMTIKDSGGRIRVLLGLSDDNIAGLRLYDINGNETVLDENGLINRFYYQYSENLDGTHPIYIPVNFDAGVGKIKTFNLNIKPSAFRSYSRGVEGGGATVGTTGSSGSVTTSTGGGGNYSGNSSTNTGGYYSNTFTSYNDVPGSGWDYFYTETTDGSVGNHRHITYFNAITHNHRVSVTVPNHSHSFNVGIGSHSHQVIIASYVEKSA